MSRVLLIPLCAVVVVLVLAGCSVVERIASDSATRLAYEIRDEAKKLLHSDATTRTFAHRPKAWPDGLTGDYRIETRSTPLSPPEKRDGKIALVALD